MGAYVGRVSSDARCATGKLGMFRPRTSRRVPGLRSSTKRDYSDPRRAALYTYHRHRAAQSEGAVRGNQGFSTRTNCVSRGALLGGPDNGQQIARVSSTLRPSQSRGLGGEVKSAKCLPWPSLGSPSSPGRWGGWAMKPPPTEEVPRERVPGRSGEHGKYRHACFHAERLEDGSVADSCLGKYFYAIHAICIRFSRWCRHGSFVDNVLL